MSDNYSPEQTTEASPTISSDKSADSFKLSKSIEEHVQIMRREGGEQWLLYFNEFIGESTNKEAKNSNLEIKKMEDVTRKEGFNFSLLTNSITEIGNNTKNVEKEERYINRLKELDNFRKERLKLKKANFELPEKSLEELLLEKEKKESKNIENFLQLSIELDNKKFSFNTEKDEILPNLEKSEDKLPNMGKEKFVVEKKEEYLNQQRPRAPSMLTQQLMNLEKTKEDSQFGEKPIPNPPIDKPPVKPPVPTLPKPTLKKSYTPNMEMTLSIKEPLTSQSLKQKIPKPKMDKPSKFSAFSSIIQRIAPTPIIPNSLSSGNSKSDDDGLMRSLTESFDD